MSEIVERNSTNESEKKKAIRRTKEHIKRLQQIKAVKEKMGLK